MNATNTTFSPFGSDLFGDTIQADTDSVVSKRFITPPFSVLSARDGAWQKRKAAWAAIGIKGECGREATSIHCPNASSAAPLEDAEYTSLFDPALCEVIYSWFTRKDFQIVDPFAGGSVLGIVAGCLERNYWGGELRAEQVAANREQEYICKTHTPVWVCGDSLETLKDAPAADFIFSCPPYGDLETYSDDPRDLSNMEFHTFLPAYGRIILRACAKLKQDRFACFVVGDFRDSKGHYRNFVSQTIDAFLSCGLQLYNEAILVTCVGSASMRVTKQFQAGRKLCKTHQNVLVFCKGDWRKAVDAIQGQDVMPL